MLNKLPGFAALVVKDIIVIFRENETILILILPPENQYLSLPLLLGGIVIPSPGR